MSSIQTRSTVLLWGPGFIFRASMLAVIRREYASSTLASTLASWSSHSIARGTRRMRKYSDLLVPSVRLAFNGKTRRNEIMMRVYATA